jgi:hypothetical protein
MKYRKKPIVIDAFLWTGDRNQTEDPEWIVDKIKSGDVFFVGGYLDEAKTVATAYMIIRTLEGKMTANVGDYIIKGIQGEIYPCKPDIFEATYEVVE